MWSCLSFIKRSCVLGHQHWLSNHGRGEQRILASTTPRGGNECSSCFPVDLSLVDMSCFPLRLVLRLTGSFKPFLQGDMDVVIWIELLGPDSWWHGFLRIQAKSWLPCREPLYISPLSLSSRTNQPFSERVLLNFIYPLKRIDARGTCHNKMSLLSNSDINESRFYGEKVAGCCYYILTTGSDLAFAIFSCLLFNLSAKHILLTFSFSVDTMWKNWSECEFKINLYNSIGEKNITWCWQDIECIILGGPALADLRVFQQPFCSFYQFAFHRTL